MAGCGLEEFGYAYDMADLDFFGTSDHTDIAKILDPYEWWQTQRLVDVFYVPGKFNSLYAYEREQRFPWGHRNVVFPQRGAPIVYIQRKNYEASPWHRLYPNQPGDEEITPLELWDLLKQYGKPVAIISHTGATSMGTDWDRYERIDGDLENTVEIYQGARVSYEGLNVPQPTVGLRVGQKYQDSPGTAPDPIDSYGSKFDRGVYQRALSHGFKLGVFASSDHISQHASYGGVYVEETTRLGIIHGFAARHSLAATDKIFVEFSCNDQPMGSIFTTSKNPEFKMAIDGTASISRVTLVRNESNYKTWEPADRHFSVSYTDPEPPTGEGRYYLRVEQVDGNMAWSSPVWVKME